MIVFRACDVESTGIPTETDRHALVEGAWCDVHRASDGDCTVMDPASMLCNPGRLIPVEAQAVHHIRDADVAGAPSPDLLCKAMGEGGDYFVAHNCSFEQQFFGGGGRPWLCTWKSALRVWPDAPSHSLSALRYWLKLDDDPLFERDLAMPPHRAGPDAYVCAFLFVELLKHATVEQMVKWTSGPALLAKCGFGKHFGLKWSEVPKDYLSWIVSKSDITDRNVRATAKFYLMSLENTTPNS